MTARNVTINIRAETQQYVRKMRAASTSTGKLNRELGMMGKVAKVGAGVAVVAVAAIGAAAVKVGIQAAQSFAEFEKSLAKIEGLVGVSKETLAGMTDELKILAVETAQGPQELAEALFFVTSAGLEGADALEALEVSAKASAAGLGDTATIADVVTSAVNAYGDGIAGAAVATDVLVATVREGKAEAPALAGALGRVIPIASQMGISFDQVGAAVAAMTRVGLDANEATTALRNVMTSLLNPSSQAEDALESLGLSAAGLRQEIRDRGLYATLETLTTAFDGNAEATSAVFGNVRALTGVLSLMGSNADATKDIFESLADSTGALDDAFAVAADTGAFEFEQAKARIETALLGVGENILPKLADAMETLAPAIPGLVDSIGELTIAFVDFAASVAPAAATALSFATEFSDRMQVGSTAVGTWVDTFNDAFDVMLGPWINIPAAVDDADKSLSIFNHTMFAAGDAMRNGMDKSDALAASMATLQSEGELTSTNMLRLQDQFRASDDAMGIALVAAMQLGDGFGFTEVAIAQLTAVWPGFIAAAKQAAISTGLASESSQQYGNQTRWAGEASETAAPKIDGLVGPVQDVRDALNQAAAESRSLADAMLEMANPTFKAQKAVAALAKAQANAVKVREDAKSTAEDVAAAELAIVEAALKAQGALDALSPTNLEASIGAISEVLGVSRDEAEELLRTLGLLDGSEVTTVVNIETRQTGFNGGNGSDPAYRFSGIEARADGGQVKAGVPYKVGERGEELFVPNENGTIVSNSVLTQNSSRSVVVQINSPTFAADVDVQGAIQSGLIAAGVTESVEWAGSTTIR